MKVQTILENINRALAKLTDINPFYKKFIVFNDWQNVSEQSNPELWKLLSNKNGKEFSIDDQTDSDDDIQVNDKLKEREMKMSFLPFLTVMHNSVSRNIASSETVNIAPLQKFKFLFLLPQNPTGKPLHFLENIQQEGIILMRMEIMQ